MWMTSHDVCLRNTLERMEQAGLKFNKEKCLFRQPELRFLGHIVDASGVRADPEKIKAIMQLQEPTDIHKLKRALGMINYMSKYIPDLAAAAGPLYDCCLPYSQYPVSPHRSPVPAPCWNDPVLAGIPLCQIDRLSFRASLPRRVNRTALPVVSFSYFSYTAKTFLRYALLSSN